MYPYLTWALDVAIFIQACLACKLGVQPLSAVEITNGTLLSNLTPPSFDGWTNSRLAFLVIV